MRLFKFFSSIVFLIFLHSSCCKQPYQICEGLDEIQKITFENFSRSELDSVFLLRYTQNSNFQNAIDSIRMDSIVSTSDVATFEGIILNGISSTNDYILQIFSINKEYRISDMNLSEETCKRCGENDFKFIFLKNLKVDNQLQTNLGSPPKILIQK